MTVSNLTLVLDKSWLPHDIVEWTAAMTLYCKGSADILEEYDHTVHPEPLLRPAVIVLKTKVKRVWYTPRFTSKNIYERDEGQCQYCGIFVPFNEFEYEHVVPQSRGGLTNWDNIVLSCRACNQTKRDRTPEEAGMRLLKKPKRPQPRPKAAAAHLKWREGYPEEWRRYLAYD